MKHFLLLIALFFTQISFGQQPVLQALVSKETVELGSNLTVSFRFNASGEDFVPPAEFTSHFRIVSGPNKSSSMSFVNGTMSSSVSYSYVVVPVDVGTFTINEAQITSDGKVYKSQKLKIKVVKPSKQSIEQKKREQDHAQRQKDDLKNSLFLKIEVDNKNPFQGQQIIATYKLYNRARLNGIEGQRLPEFDGFYTSDLEVNNNNNHSREVINDVIYDVYTLKKTILIPQKSGELNLIPLEIDANVQIQDSKPVNTWFGPRYQYKNVSTSLKSNAVKIKVKPLPKGAPKDFSGAVGTFKFVATLSPPSLPINDALNLKVKISGTGNLPLIDQPTVNWPTEFEAYSPKLKSNIQNETGTIKGAKTWETIVIPRVNGSYQIEPISFSYFNPNSQKYETITSQTFHVEVTGDASDLTNSGTNSGFIQQELDHLGTDIRFIKTNTPKLKRVGNQLFGSIYFYVWILLSVVGAFLAYILIQKQTNLKKDVVGFRKKQATRMAKKSLANAQKLLGQDQHKFHESISLAIFGYLKNKLNLKNSELNKDLIRTKLENTQISEEVINAYLEVIDTCEMARFAPSMRISQNDLLKKAETVIVKLEEELK